MSGIEELMKNETETTGGADEIRVYLDMDGVLADFARGLRELCRLEAAPQDGAQDAARDDRMWAAIRDTAHFYDRLELMPGAAEMFRLLREKYGDRCEILTGVPREERGIVTAEEDKIRWTHRLLGGDVRVHTVCRKHKQLYCRGPRSVLIDDREKTIREWRALGGTGILFVSAEQALEELRSLGLL